MQFRMQFQSRARHATRQPLRTRRAVVAVATALAVVVAGPALAIALGHHQRVGHQSQVDGSGQASDATTAAAPSPSRGRVPDPTVEPPPEPTAEPTPGPTVEATPEATPDAASSTSNPVEPPVAPQPASPAAQIEAGIVAVTNAQRAERGLGALSISPCATSQVTIRVAQLVAENGFYHPPMGPVVDACKAGAGENLALGYSDGTGVVDGWMSSPGHRENLLRATYVSVGVSCQQQNGRWLCGAVYLTS